jgi:2-polyprenyl-3-methyl-5-hydroxy-6-metoxy-1,4-benzoquinol methylase
VDTVSYFADKQRQYRQCTDCHLVFVPRAEHLDHQAEKAMYDRHENDPNDMGYRRFLSRMATPLIARLRPNASGLDFGCGPGPTLSVMLEEAGHQTALYDVYYYPETDVLSTQYDFVTATEVIEHLCYPDRVWQQWLTLVKPNGWIGIMTKMVIDVGAFANWHYKSDPTHICFYSKKTFQFLAERDKLHIEFIGNDVILLRKPNHESK